MIITQLHSGLGNQLFHYAAARAVSERLKVPLKLDITSFQESPIYQFELESFNISAEFATEKEVDRAVNLPENLIDRTLLRISERMKPAYKRRSILWEKDYHFTDLLSTATHSSYIAGHWQSEKYFKEYASLIRHDFSLKKKITDDRSHLVDKVMNTVAISLVVRRGDYLKYKNLNLYGDDMTYYYQAMEIMNSKIVNPHYFIFSDDIEWVKTNLSITQLHTFVSEPYPGEDYKVNPRRHLDLILMSRCKHHIITNSTFAWWGAWLNPDINKIVIAPKQWFGEGNLIHNKVADTKDLIPESWIKI